MSREIVLTIPNVSLAAKIDLVGAALLAIREAHKDEMHADCWAALNRAGHELGAAVLHAGKARAGHVRIGPVP